MVKSNSLAKISVKGAQEHNLKDINVQIPKNKLVVFAGVSGSGKSSLAMDTLYAEGQRRYVESLSAYARQFLGMMKRPEVDTIEGLSPSIAIDQKSLSHNPRSTVGTVTEIWDFLRVLYARIGHPHCPQCGREVVRQTGVSIAEQILKIMARTVKTNQTGRFLILAPVVRDKRGEFKELFANLKRKGFDKVRVDGHTFHLHENILLIKTNRHQIEVVTDRFNLIKKFSPDKFKARVLDAVEIALELSDGLATLAEVKDKAFTFPEKPKKMKDTIFSRRFACPACSLSLPEISPRLFSFNSPHGACPECNGLGIKLKVDRTRISPWRAEMLEKRYYQTTSETIRQEISKLMIKETCPKCQGQRLHPDALGVTIDQKSIADLAQMSLDKLNNWLKKLPLKLKSQKSKEVAKPLLKEVLSRLNFLLAVGVDYLTLNRMTATLSVGEAQRIRLASQIGTGLTGVLYILDEPTVGLHQRDTKRLIKTLKNLRDLGNTVIVVEHDQEILNAADWIVDFGPGAGKKGGRVVASGPPEKIKKTSSLTGQYLSGKKRVKFANEAISPSSQILTISGCRLHNLKNIKVSFPLGRFICATGVSGSGKSTLIHETLYPALKKALDRNFRQKPGKFNKITGFEPINHVYLVDQSPIGKTSRSNPATYTGVFTEIRELMSQTREAQLKGLTKSHFSFNVDKGRCEACKGQGMNRIEMQFLPDVWVTCEECSGTRFKNEVLEVEYKEKNIDQILKLTVGEAIIFFGAFPKIQKKLKVLEKIGLDYLELGQPSPTLSGGESQRLKLARELVRPANSHTLYLLDEPTTGLHFADVEKLLAVIRELVDKGNTVLVIEHNLDVIKNADWVIDLGPEGGERGGELVTFGPPKKVAQNQNSWTGRFLKKHLWPWKKN